MAQQYIFTMRGLNKKFGDHAVLKDVSLSFYPGAKIGVLGKNGAGKSTLMKIMAGQDTDYEGEARLTPGFTVGYVPQEPAVDLEKTVRQTVEEGVAAIHALLARASELEMAMADPDLDADQMEKVYDDYGHIQEEIERTDAYNVDRKLEIAADAMMLPPDDALMGTLSGGERRRVAMCRMLLQHPDLLLLDEPTNHLDAESVAWLERFLHEYTGTVVAVTHDRYFLDNVTGWILEVERGRCIPFEGNYSAWLKAKQDRLEVEDRQSVARRKTLARELEWIRMSPKARQAKSKARVAAYEKLSQEQFEEREEEFELQIPPGPYLGTMVMEAADVTKGYGDRTLINKLTCRIPPGGIVGVIGPNGAGKTTLFRMIVGQEQPDSGVLRLGDTVTLGYVDQSRDTLDPEATVWQEISGGHDTIDLGGRVINSRSYVAKFNFKKSDQQKKVGLLSGGERNRVHLAKLLRRGCNLLLLDEPTNDLDVDTLRALEDAILNFAGSVIVISHDRWFLDRVATHILAFEGEGHVHWCEGNFQTYEQQRRERKGQDPDEPGRMRFKRLKR
jgi:ATP-binding cassette ChvD family protein